jgi:peptidoglycan hydrolase CwlO-like protein
LAASRRRFVIVARVMLVVGVSGALLSPSSSSADEPDPAETERQLAEVREARGEVGLEVDALEAQDTEVRDAIAALETNVATQQAELDEAERALEAAEAEVVAATQAVEQGQAEIDELDAAAEAMVVETFVNPPADNALDSFRSETISETMVKQALVEIQSDTGADLLDQLEQAHEDLEVAKADKQALAAEAEEKRVTAEAELAEVENALAEQEAFSADVEERLNAKLAEAESLRTFDSALAERLVREQAEVAARLRAAQEAAAAQAAREAAAAAAAQRAAAAPAPSGGGGGGGGDGGGGDGGGGGGGGGGGPAQSVIQPAPGGLATVTCPFGGSIQVAGSIAGNVQALLDLAAAQGVSLCASSGWRSPEKQIELRRAHCGTSYYAIYEMPSSQCNPPTARPGSSLHERGLAIDFSCNGGGAIRHGNSCWNFLVANANDYGLYNLPSEPWHWPTTGR